MTELEIMQRAKMYMDKLARGIDPISNQELTGDTVLNNVRLSRCFLYVSDILGKVIDNGGLIGEKPRLLPFAITPEQLASVQLSQEPVAVSQLAQLIGSAAEEPGRKKLSYAPIANWLQQNGFLEKQATSDGHSKRVPTDEGRRIGLTLVTRQGIYGEYQSVLYDRNAQQFVLDHLSEILAENGASSEK